MSSGIYEYDVKEVETDLSGNKNTTFYTKWSTHSRESTSTNPHNNQSTRQSIHTTINPILANPLDRIISITWLVQWRPTVLIDVCTYEIISNASST